ncbi:hypothetical protein CDV31_002163 [Fusarium ambrosium]|uniref:Uncharacterized protein n=1 Tax=Fusarium ambrosium TaxID=131363 RepID=A0A428UXN9_9HYPO|nr:hypothetical protein CDV31_002163 [Fusarium ambrosium]
MPNHVTKLKVADTMSSTNPTSAEEAVLDPETPTASAAASKDEKAKTIPKSAQAMNRTRPRAKSVKAEPTLLYDFLKGRPSPARLAADRQRRMSLEAVKAELRHEMKQSQVKRLQPPGGVRDRVKKWQKANAAAMVDGGEPDDAATEPTDVAFKEDDFRSVTEEDRVRIKMRKKIKTPNNKTKESLHTEDEKTPEPTPAKPPPKKRVVSDEHWRKNRKNLPKKGVPEKFSSPAPLPKDFVARNCANPSVSNKVKAWASKVEIPDTPPSGSHRFSKSVGSRPCWDTDSEFMSDMGETISEMTPSNVNSSRVTAQRTAKSVSGADDGIRVRAQRPAKSVSGDDGIRVTPMRKKLDDDGIRVTPIKPNDDGIRVTPTNPNDDGIRVTPINPKDDGIRVRPMSEVSSNAGTSRPGSIRTARLRLKSAPTSRRPSMQSERRKQHSDLSRTDLTSELSSRVIDSESELSKTTRTGGKSEQGSRPVDDSMVDTPTKRRSVSGKKPRPKSYHPGTTTHKDKETWVPEDDSTLEPSQLDGSDLSSSILAKSIADIPGDIPWGNSAFTELDLPLRARGGPLRSRPKRPARPKVERNTSFKSMPKVFKKAAPNNPPSIEKWLNNTVDPFVEDPKAEPPTSPIDEASDMPSSPETVKSRQRPSRVEKRRESVSKMRKPDVAEKAASKEHLAPAAEPVPEPVPVKEKPRPEPKPEPAPKPKVEPAAEPEPQIEPEPESHPEQETVKEPSPESRSQPKPKPKRQATKPPTKTPGGPGLKRTRATRNTSSPVNKTGPKAYLLGMLKEAFQGESGNHLPKPKTYQSQEERQYDDDPESVYTDSRYDDPRPDDSRYDDSRYEDSRYDDSRYDDSHYDESHYDDSRYDDELTYDDSTENWTETELSKPPKAEMSGALRSMSPEEQRERPQERVNHQEPVSHQEPVNRQEQVSRQESVIRQEPVARQEPVDRQERVKSPNRDDRMDLPSARMAGPRLRPPTNGQYELSTILSEEDSSAVESDLTSDVTHSTLTQSTVLTRGSSRSKSQKRGSSLKRRLTRHSDLVSVLSLPDDNNIPNGIKSNRSRPSIRKSRGGPNDVTNDDLLREFAEDENLYLRELKTLVDGVIPVLLSQVVNGDNATELFGSAAPTTKTDAVSKSVVHMGVALEKLRMAHRKAPVSDIRRLASWGHGVVPIYHKYLDAWRLGFQDLVVNLAPAMGAPEDEDSLIGAMPRNESGDLIDSTGERVDVAHLLKRPVLRLKQMAKFFKCVDSIIATNDTYDLLRDFEDLQEKARRRHREEMARLTDEDAINTDTTRARDLRTLGPMEAVYIEPSRQVSAKDFFSLDLSHSNGQRLECQIELVHRDNLRHPEDKGDILIRENGVKGKSFLLFPPVPVELISARTGDSNFDMVVMIRGTHNDRPWHELLTLTTDNEDQILDWLDILPVKPYPPREPEPSVIGDEEEPSSRQDMLDVPVGVRGSSRKYSSRSSRHSSYSAHSAHSARSPVAESPPASPTTPTTPTGKRPLPSRYRPRSASPATPPPMQSPESYDLQRTPTQNDYRYDDRQLPLFESLQPDPLNIRKTSSGPSYRNDGAPPPPVHRELTPSPGPTAKSQFSKPLIELPPSSRVKRRTSSPLKHEYLPSDGSSVSGTSLTGSYQTEDYTETESDYESSDDEIESVDLPETELGFSIRDDLPEDIPEERPEDLIEELESSLPMPRTLVDSVVSGSSVSLTPSNSASQAGLHGQKVAPEENAMRFIAAISRWSDKGIWKDISVDNCSVIVTPGMIQAFPVRSEQDEAPILALDLTPLVLIRQSTAVDLEIRSAVRSDCQLANSHGGGNFRFRCQNGPDCFNLYMSVHHARLNNQKFIQLENEARFKSFGERKAPVENDDTSSRRRSWFGRKNSYRSSVRAPSQSHDGASTTPSSTLSATSFLKRLTGAANLPFNLARSSVDRNSRYNASLKSPGSSSWGGATPRSPSISVENSGRGPANFGTEDIKIRLHLLVSAAKWEDYGNCRLSIRRPPPGWHQALRADHGLEKRVTVKTIPRKDSDQPVVLLDAVLGSGCFTPMGSRGIVCGIWEEMKDHNGVVGVVPATGPTGGNVKKWCFQCASVAEAGWVLRLVHQEVVTA